MIQRSSEHQFRLIQLRRCTKINNRLQNMLTLSFFKIFLSFCLKLYTTHNMIQTQNVAIIYLVCNFFWRQFCCQTGFLFSFFVSVLLATNFNNIRLFIIAQYAELINFFKSHKTQCFYSIEKFSYMYMKTS